MKIMASDWSSDFGLLYDNLLSGFSRSLLFCSIYFTAARSMAVFILQHPGIIDSTTAPIKILKPLSHLAVNYLPSFIRKEIQMQSIKIIWKSRKFLRQVLEANFTKGTNIFTNVFLFSRLFSSLKKKRKYNLNANICLFFHQNVNSWTHEFCSGCCAWSQTNVFLKMFAHLWCCPRWFFVEVVRDFRIILNLLTWISLPSGTNAFKFLTGAIVLSFLFGCCKIITARYQELVFIGQKSSEALWWRHN